MTVRALFSRITPLLLILALFVAACHDDQPNQPETPAGKGVASGVITDESGLIVPYATVEALDAGGTTLAIDTTDESGAFSLNGLPDDLSSVSMKVGASTFKPFLTRLLEAAQASGGSTGLLLHLLHDDSCCGKVVITVTNSSGGAALANVEVRLRRGDHLITIATTDSNGRVIFNHVCPGEFNVRLAASGFHVVEHGDILIHQCDSVGLALTMTGDSTGGDHDSCCNGVLRIIPRDSSTTAIISGASVRISKSGSTETVTSNGDGAIFRGVCPGTYGVRIAKDGSNYHVLEFSITVGCNDTVTISRGLLQTSTGHDDSCCHGMITLGVVDSSTGAALAGAAAHLWSGGTQVATHNTEGGSVSFTGLCAGTYSISVGKDGYAGREFSFTLGCNDTVTRSLAILHTGGDTCHNAVLSLRVKDSTVAEGGWLSGVTVTITRGSATVASGSTNGDGRFGADGLTGRTTYTVTFSKDGYHSKTLTFTFDGCTTITETVRLTPI